MRLKFKSLRKWTYGHKLKPYIEPSVSRVKVIRETLNADAVKWHGKSKKCILIRYMHHLLRPSWSQQSFKLCQTHNGQLFFTNQHQYSRNQTYCLFCEFSLFIDAVWRKSHHVLQSFNVNGTKMFHSFYRISPHVLLCWYGSLPLSNTNRLQGVVDVSCTTLNDLTHQFKLLPSGRGYNLPKCRTNGLQCSLVPAAISLLNNVIFMYFLFIFLSDIYLNRTQSFVNKQ